MNKVKDMKSILKISLKTLLKKSHKRSWLLQIFVGLVLSLSLSARAQDAPPQMPPTSVSVVLAEEKVLAPTIKATGSVVSLQASRISSQVSGELTWIATVGTSVKKGEVIAKINATILNADRQIAESQVKKFEADLEFRNQEVTRFKRLANKDNASKTRLQQEVAKRNMLLQDIFGAKADLTKAKYDFQHATIKAPFSGHLVSRSASVGEYLTKGAELLKLVDTFHKEVVLNAPMRLLSVLKKNMRVQVSGQKKNEKLSIGAIVPVGDENSRMIEIRLVVESDLWTVGESVSILLPSSLAQKRVVIPRDALVIRGTDLFIFRVDSEMNAQQIKVEIKSVDNAWVSLIQDINIGDKIIVRGGERLRSGQKVSVLKSPE